MYIYGEILSFSTGKINFPPVKCYAHYGFLMHILSSLFDFQKHHNFTRIVNKLTLDDEMLYQYYQRCRVLRD